MKPYSLALGFVALLGLTAIASAESPELSIRLGVKLSDGSYVIGVPTDSSLPVETSFAKVKIPLDQIETIQLNDDHETVAIKFHNGDSLTAVLNFRSMELTTIIGKVTFKAAQFEHVNIIRGLTPRATVTPMTWQKRDVPWRKRSAHSSVVFDEKMWITGGRIGDTALSDVWSSADGTEWEQVVEDANWPARYGHVALVHGGKIWVMGGKSRGKFTNDVWCSENGRDWQRVKEHAPWDGRYGFAGFVKDGRMWIAGGHGKDKEGKGRDYDDVWCSADGGMWTKVVDGVPWGLRSAMAYAVHDDKMWIVGGGHQGKHMNDVWWSENGEDWIEATPRAAWSKRFGHAAVSHDGRLWMLGGQRAGPRQNDIWSTNDGAKWIRHSEHSAWRARSSARALSHRGDLWILAGEHDYQKGIADAWRLAWLPPRNMVQDPDGEGAKQAPPQKGHGTENSLTGIWQGTFYANQKGAVSKAYLEITQHADGSLSGRWGNSPNGALKIEHGECVTQGVFRWEASSEANEQGRYRVRATLKGKTLQLDIAYTWREAGKVKGLTAASILTKKAKKGFPILTSAKITDKPYGMFCVADFNGDGHLDFAVSDKTKGSESVDVYLNDGEGSLIKKASYPVGNYPQHIVAGDFNEDGDVDLIVPVYHGALGDGTMHLLTGNGDGTFKIGPGFSPKVNGKGLHPNRMAVGDLNKDGHLDFVVEMGNDWAINIHWGKGDGTFTPMYTRSNGQNPGNTKICDLNNDSWPDIVSGSQYTSLFVHLSDLGDGYNAPVQYLKSTSRRQPIIVGDLDGDEDIDVLCAHYTSPRYVSVMINDGNGVFTAKGKIDFPDGTGLAKVTDFDFDGKMDFVLGSGNNVLVVPGNGDGTFQTPVAYDMGHKVGGLQLHDLNHDGRLDLVYIDYDSHKVMMRLNASLPSMDVPGDAVLTEPPGEFQIDYAGLRWDFMRTGWRVVDRKLASQRHVRPGFQYGHWANGRGGMVITGNGDQTWTDYEVAFDYKMLPANKEFFHAHIPGDSRGMYVIMRAKSVSESWNEPSTHYTFSLMPTGKWRLGTYEDWYMTGCGYSADRRKGKHEHLHSGTAARPSEGRLRFRLQGDTISVWKDVNIICRFSHTGSYKGKEVGPILYGGFGVGWRYESMGWISNLEVKKLSPKAN